MILLTAISIAHKSNIVIYDILFLFTSICLGLYFKSILFGKFKKYLIMAVFASFVLYAFIKLLNYRQTEMFDSVSFSLLSLIITIISFFYFYQTLSNVTEKSLLQSIDFWFVTSLFIYYSGSFIIFLTFYNLTEEVLKNNYTLKDRILLTNLWGVHNMLLFISSLIFNAGSLWIIFRKKP